MEISCTIAWDCCDIPMVLLCDSYGGCWGIPGVLSGDHCGTTLALLWECFGIAAILPWDSYGIALRILDRCDYSTVMEKY